MIGLTGPGPEARTSPGETTAIDANVLDADAVGSMLIRLAPTPLSSRRSAPFDFGARAHRAAPAPGAPLPLGLHAALGALALHDDLRRNRLAPRSAARQGGGIFWHARARTGQDPSDRATEHSSEHPPGKRQFIGACHGTREQTSEPDAEHAFEHATNFHKDV